MGNPDTPTMKNNDPPHLGTLPGKGRRKKSIVWDYFTVETVGADCTRAICKQCKKSFAYISGSKLAGTSHLKRHISLGICPVSHQKHLPTPDSKNSTVKRRYRSTSNLGTIPFSQEGCSREMAKMIILHDYPLHIVEHPGFIGFVRNLQPLYHMPSFASVQRDCVDMYLKEKQKLLNFISAIPGRVSLTLDLWTSGQTLGYVLLTGHFIDVNFNLQRRILNVVMVSFPYSDAALDQAVVACLSDWHLEGKLFTLNVDQSLSNETVMMNLRGLLSVKNPLTLGGQLLIGNCYARILSQLALEALGSMSMSEIIWRIREGVKFVKTSEACEEKFNKLRQQLQVPSKKDLVIDDQNKWNTTYDMLVAACELKEVFACLDVSGPDYKITFSMDDWKHVEILCTYLKLLYDAANILTAPLYPTANIFFHEVWKLQMELTSAAIGEDPFINHIIKPLYEKFNTYWMNCCLVLAIPVVMDPRFKLKLVQFSFSKIYGKEGDELKRMVEDCVFELFLEYNSQTLTLPSTFVKEGNESSCKTEAIDESVLITTGVFPDFEVYISEIPAGEQMKSELDRYLEEPLLYQEEEFDVLYWWKTHRIQYPTLSRMASDILSIPFSTVASDSVFDTEPKEMDSYRSSLQPITVEALACAKDWLRYGSSDISSEFSHTSNLSSRLG